MSIKDNTTSEEYFHKLAQNGSPSSARWPPSRTPKPPRRPPRSSLPQVR